MKLLLIAALLLPASLLGQSPVGAVAAQSGLLSAQDKAKDDSTTMLKVRTIATASASPPTAPLPSQQKRILKRPHVRIRNTGKDKR